MPAQWTELCHPIPCFTTICLIEFPNQVRGTLNGPSIRKMEARKVNERKDTIGVRARCPYSIRDFASVSWLRFLIQKFHSRSNGLITQQRTLGSSPLNTTLPDWKSWLSRAATDATKITPFVKFIRNSRLMLPKSQSLKRRTITVINKNFGSNKNLNARDRSGWVEVHLLGSIILQLLFCWVVGSNQLPTGMLRRPLYRASTHWTSKRDWVFGLV